MAKNFAKNENQQTFDFRQTKKGLTEVSQLHTYELISYIIHNNPAFKSPKAIAVDAQVDLSTVYRWGENPKASGINLLDERLISFIRSTKSLNLIVRYLRSRCEEK